MKFQADLPNTSAVQAYGPDWLNVDGKIHKASVLLSNTGLRVDWPCARFEDLSAELFAQAIDLGEGAPELVIFGSGSKLRFPKPEWLKPLIQARVGIESMDLGAASRTFNILSGEGRRVVLAALIEPAASS